jgi:hypothetical protein
VDNIIACIGDEMQHRSFAKDLVQMSYLLQNATERSLLLIDELGKVIRMLVFAVVAPGGNGDGYWALVVTRSWHTPQKAQN